MTISIDLNGGASGSDATTAFTEQSIVSLFSSAALSANGGDSNSIDTVTLTLASATGTESLSLQCCGFVSSHKRWYCRQLQLWNGRFDPKRFQRIDLRLADHTSRRSVR